MGETKEIFRMVEEKEFRKTAVQTGAVRKLQETLFKEKGNYEYQKHLNSLRDLDNWRRVWGWIHSNTRNINKQYAIINSKKTNG